MTHSGSSCGACGDAEIHVEGIEQPISKGSVTNNLLDDHIDDFAYYLAAIVHHARDEWGIDFSTVKPFNEPLGPFWNCNGRQEGNYVDRNQQQAVLRKLRE